MPDQTAQYIQKVFTTLASQPTSADLDFLVEAFTRVGYLAGEAEGLADEAEARRKNAVANAYLTAKRSAEKISDRQAEAIAEVETWEIRQAAITAKTKSVKMKNLLEAIQEAIWAVKHLGRYDSGMTSTVTTPSR